MTSNSFGLLLRTYRHKAIDPQTDRPLSQQRLGQLLGEIVGSTYSAQAVSDWERDQSQIHKDHRQVLLALIESLFLCGGLTTPEEANRLLKTGNYRGLNLEELEQVFGSQEISPEDVPAVSLTWSGRFLASLGDVLSNMTPQRFFKALALLLCWLTTWLGILPLVAWPVASDSALTNAVLQYALTSLAVPVVIAWASTEKDAWLREKASPIHIALLRLIGGQIGFTLGVLSILALTLISYHLYLYPYPGWLLLFLFLWPIVLGFASAREVPINQIKAYGRMEFKAYGRLLATFLLPFLLSWFFYQFHPILLSRIWGPLSLLFGMAALGGALFLQTRRTT